jgi:DNA-binding Lrp family transcriptional regulator
MRNNRVLKPQDIVVLAKLVTDEVWPTQKDIANALELSQSEISHSLKTLELVGLINIFQKRINKLAVQEFIVHAVKFFYPPEKHGIGRGIKVGPSYSYFSKKVHSDEFDYVWPDPDGESKGVIVSPLISRLSKTIKANEKLFLLLNIIEVFRGLGGVRHQQVAQKALKEILK